MKNFSLPATLIMCSFLVACANPFGDKDFYEREFEAYLPSEDPLVLAHFERALNDNNIAYRRDAEGRFSVIDHRQDGDMDDVVDEFTGKVIPKHVMDVQRGCAAQSLQSFLRRERIVFVWVGVESGIQLQLSESDYIAHEIAERWADIQASCAEQPAE